MARVIIGIPTFRRPESLAALILSLATHDGADQVTLVVVDSEGASGAGLAIVRSLAAAGLPFAVDGLPAPGPGISAARNQLMDTAFGKHGADGLIMLDDDQLVADRWLDAILKAASCEVDIVSGRVRPLFEAHPPRWAEGQPIFWDGNTDARACGPVGAGNTLLSRRIWAIPHLRFSDAFAFSGGEDQHFFKRAIACGARYSYAPDAVALERVGIERLTLRWALSRSLRIGSTDYIIAKELGARGNGFMQAVYILGAAAAATASVLIGPATRTRIAGLLLLARQIGKLQGLLGVKSRAYGHR